MTYLAEFHHYGQPVWFSVDAIDWQDAERKAQHRSPAAVVVGRKWA